MNLPVSWTDRTAAGEARPAEQDAANPDSMLGDLHNPRWMYLKAVLLLGVGLLASTILLLDSPNLRTAALLAMAVWGFCRAYYFAFYVVQRYADPGYRFAGLLDFARYVLRRRRNESRDESLDH